MAADSLRAHAATMARNAEVEARIAHRTQTEQINLLTRWKGTECQDLPAAAARIAMEVSQ
jgi:hypothetical protein